MKPNELSPAAGPPRKLPQGSGQRSATARLPAVSQGPEGLLRRRHPYWLEGGQMPLARRIPKRGFNNIFAKPLEIINLASLDKFEDGDIVTAEALLAKGILSKCEYGYKVLGNGKVTKKVTVQAAAFSQAAKEAIEAAGGKAEVI
ncbi:MAG: 50S ribosomal protein L15 [Oscillospiraceae bacterium]